jgi:hypothetical protein
MEHLEVPTHFVVTVKWGVPRTDPFMSELSKHNKNQNMKKIISAIGISCLILVATSIAARAEDDLVVKHFTESGSFFTGKKYGTWQEFPDVATTNAFKRAYAYVAKNGYKILSSDREMGVISATQDVVHSQKTVPLNILVEDSGHGGSKVTLTFSIGGGLSTSKKGVQETFSKIMAEVGKNSEAP